MSGLAELVGGGSATATVESANPEIAGSTALPVKVTPNYAGEQTGIVSLEIDMSQSRNYNKYGIRAFVRTTCAKGEEDVELQRLIDATIPVVEQLEEMSDQKLDNWANR